MSGYVGSLGMYDSIPLQPANDALWQAIAARLGKAGLEGVPSSLDRSRPLEEIWDDPAVLLAQTCGYPLMTRWNGRLKYLTTPSYRAPGADDGWHRSLVIVRRDDGAQDVAALRRRTVALNARHSNSGMNLLRALVAPFASEGMFFGRAIETGSHAASARLVATGGADVAAIDAVTFAHLAREDPDLTGKLRTLASTERSPCLPFVTSAVTPDHTVHALRDAIDGAIADCPEAAAILLLDGTRPIGVQSYRILLDMEEQAQRLGYPELA